MTCRSKIAFFDGKFYNYPAALSSWSLGSTKLNIWQVYWLDLVGINRCMKIIKIFNTIHFSTFFFFFLTRCLSWRASAEVYLLVNFFFKFKLLLLFNGLLSYLVGMKRRTSRRVACKTDNSHFLRYLKKKVHNTLGVFSGFASLLLLSKTHFKSIASRKHAYIILTPLNHTCI